jgi:hypothetical protein
MKTGRNDPCPCGSGKKYKHCCLSPASVANDELKDLLAGQEFDSLEDVQALTNQFMQQKNLQPQDDFQGLSPEQIHRMLYFPFESPEYFSFPETLSVEPEAPILTLMQLITGAIDEKGLKATAKGNLPQKLCKEAIIDYRKLLPETDYLHRMNISREDDFDDLHTARIILEISGLLRKTKGRFFLTKKYQKLIAKAGLAGLYSLILKTYCRKFNWGYRDGFDEIPFIQHSFLFSMYLLQLHGNDWKPFLIYEDYFLHAFPMVTDEANSNSYRSAEDEVRDCFDSRTLHRFLHFLGLASIETIPNDKPISREYRIMKLPLLDEVVRFSV